MQIKQSLKEFFQNKTNWVALTAIGSGVVGYLSHSIDAVDAFKIVMGGLGGLCIRDTLAGMEKSSAPAS